MPFDFKKEYKEFYLPPQKPAIVRVPAMNYIAVSGRGNPNEEGGDYQQAVGMLYAIAYTVKMSKKGSRAIEGYFDYVVPPLEGFWDQNAAGSDSSRQDCGIDYSRKEDFRWISVIRLPDFVRKEDFEWAKAEAERKKKLDLSKAEFFRYEEGLCVQCMHVGSFDDEPETVRNMHEFIAGEGYSVDLSERLHHEIYLSDPRKTDASACKTVIRHPVKPL